MGCSERRVDLLVGSSEQHNNKQIVKLSLVSFSLRILQHPQWTVIKLYVPPSALSQPALLSEVSYDKVCLITNCLVTLYALPDAHISLRNCCILFSQRKNLFIILSIEIRDSGSEVEVCVHSNRTILE